MAALGVVAVSAMVLADGGLSGDVPDTPTGTPEAAALPLVRLHLSGADIAHFEELHTLLDGPPPQESAALSTGEHLETGAARLRWSAV